MEFPSETPGFKVNKDGIVEIDLVEFPEELIKQFAQETHSTQEARDVKYGRAALRNIGIMAARRARPEIEANRIHYQGGSLFDGKTVG